MNTKAYDKAPRTLRGRMGTFWYRWAQGRGMAPESWGYWCDHEDNGRGRRVFIQNGYMVETETERTFPAQPWLVVAEPDGAYLSGPYPVITRAMSKALKLS